MKNYKITLRDHLIHIFPLLVIVLITLGIGYYMSLVNNGTPPYWIYIPWIAFHILPTILVHWNYFLANNSNVLFYDTSTKKIQILYRSNRLTFFLNEIKFVTVYKSFALQKGNIQLLSWDSYNHMIIELENGTQIVLTSLLMGIHNSLPIPEEKIVIKMNLFRWINGPSIRIPH